MISGSGEDGVEQKGDKIVEVRKDPPAEVPFDTLGSIGKTNTERIFGIPLDTKMLKGLLTD